MKKLLTALLVVAGFTVFGRGIESVESQSHRVDFKAKNVSASKFKIKGIKLLKKLIRNQSEELSLKSVLKSKRVGLSEINITVRYVRLGEVLVKQSYKLIRSEHKLVITTTKYDGFANYKLILDGVQQTFEHNPDTTAIDINNSVNNENNNENINKNNNKNKNRNVNKNKNRNVNKNKNRNVNKNVNKKNNSNNNKKVKK